MPLDVSAWKALYIAFVKCCFVANTGILTILWCMDLIFIGSFLIYGFLALLGNSKICYAVYIVGVLLLFPFPKYAVFLPFTLEYTYVVGTFLFLNGVILSRIMQKFFSAKKFISQSKFSFSFLLIQIPLLLVRRIGCFGG